MNIHFLSRRRAWRLVGVTLCVGLVACAVPPKHPALQAADRAGTLAPQLPTRQFVANAERIGAFVLSPDGERLLWSQRVGLDAGIATRRVSAGSAVTAYPVGNQGRGGGYYQWLPDSRHFVFTKDERGDENIRLFVQDAEQTQLAPWDLSPTRGVRSFMVGYGPTGSARFVFTTNQRDTASFDLYEGDAATRTVREVARNDGRVTQWVLDTEGALAARLRQLGADDGADRVYERLMPDGQWAPLLTVGGFDFFEIRRFDSAARKVWALSNVQRDKVALIEWSLDSGQQTVMADHAAVDLGRVVFAGRSGPPVAYTADPGYPEIRFLDPHLAETVRTAVAKATAAGLLNGQPIVARPSSSEGDSDGGGDRMILRTESEYDKAELLWDRRTGTVERLNTRFDAALDTLVPTEPFTFRASDGRSIAGYLKRPRGVTAPAPLVVLIHGGPWARDFWVPASFSLSQLLVNRGYAVLQVNYRGSMGYGRDHAWAADREYNGRLQQDIAEAVQWAVDKGVADPKALAVMGASFGGFSVLAQLAQKPHAYRCGVNIVGAANWPRLIESWPPFWRYRHYFKRTFGDVNDPAERATMLRSSPVSYLDQISAPLLVIQGANDVRVLRQDSDDVVNALRARGHPVSYLLFDNEGHAISKWRNRVAMSRAIEDFLADCLGGRSAGFDYYQLMPR